MHTPLVTAEWVYENRQKNNLILLDASMAKVIGKEPIVYDSPVCIPDSFFIDLDKGLTDLNCALPHTFPGEEQIKATLERFAITMDANIVIYDNQGIYSSPRAWWILKSFGLQNVYVLNGGLPAWVENGYSTSKNYANVPDSPSSLTLSLTQDALKTKDDILANLNTRDFTVIDARSQARFLGQQAEPRAGVSSGHIPASLNLPFTHLLDEHTFKNNDALRSLFSALPLKKTTHLVFSCGSGVTACIVLLAAVLAGYKNVSLYDGSWAEWGSDASLPFRTATS